MNTAPIYSIDRFSRDAMAWRTETLGRPMSEVASLRVAEEFCEAVQSLGVTLADFIALAANVWIKPRGDLKQEIGGVMMTLAVLCEVQGISLSEAASTELQRAIGKSSEIQEKERKKPHAWSQVTASLPHSTALPEKVADSVRRLMERAVAEQTDGPYRSGYLDSLEDLMRNHFSLKCEFVPGHYKFIPA